MKKQPSYRIVVADARKPRDGKSIDILGSYSPQRKDKPLKLDMEKVEKWIAVGAKPTEPARKLVEKAQKVAAETGEKQVFITSTPRVRKPKEQPAAEPAVESLPEEPKIESESSITDDLSSDTPSDNTGNTE